MPPKPTCGVCAQPPKYRCTACPVRYCSVACYKVHKEACEGVGAAAPAPSLEPGTTEPTESTETPTPKEGEAGKEAEHEPPLRPLTSLNWPPEPDPMVFSDPLRRDDPKPLRPVELERIATSQPIRDLLADARLPRILGVLDTLPSRARHEALARLLGVDDASLARPAAAATLERGSPPPLGELLEAAARPERRGGAEWGAEGWWLGREERVWIGEEERQLVRLWAGVVVREIDGEGVGGEGAWGQGELAWEV